MSFRHKDRIYISATGSCFGTMKKEDFAVLSMDGTVLSEKKPSKEWPLHLALYEKSSETGAVIHTHSTFSVLWSFVPAKNDQDCIPEDVYKRQVWFSTGPQTLSVSLETIYTLIPFLSALKAASELTAVLPVHSTNAVIPHSVTRR